MNVYVQIPLKYIVVNKNKYYAKLEAKMPFVQNK